MPPAGRSHPLRAHCKRGDATRAKHTLQQMRALSVPLEPQGYSDLLSLAAQGGVGKLLVLSPDLLHPLPCYTPYRATPLTVLQPLLDCRIPEGETTAMHLILKSADAKTSGKEQVASSK